MQILKNELHLEVEHNGTTFQIPKQFGEMLYIRLLTEFAGTIIIQIDFPANSPDPEQLAMSYNMEPDKRQYVSDDDLQNIGEAISMLLLGEMPDVEYNNSSKESN